MGITEIFSIFLERLSRNPSYLKSLRSRVKDDIQIDRIIAKNNFMDLFFITFYTANTLMKVEYWEKDLTIDSASDLYSRLIREYLGFYMPGEYLAAASHPTRRHNVCPECILLLRLEPLSLRGYIMTKFGETWWKEKEAGAELRKIMNPGAKLDLAIFSRLDTSGYLKELCANH